MQSRELAENLIEKLKKPVKLCVLWEWKTEFYQLPEEIYEESPILSSAMTQIKIMEGRLDEAAKYLQYTKKEQRIYNYTKLIMPNLEPQELIDVLYHIVDYGGGVTPNLTLSASRPTILNGVKDFSKYGDFLENHKEQILMLLQAVYGDAATGVYEIALAEHLYQMDKCFEALVLIVGMIPFMEDKRDLRCLFAALTLEMYILVVNGQAASAAPLMENIRKKVEITDEGFDGQLDASVTIADAPMIFENKYEAVPTKVQISAAKVLNGRALKADEFEFVIEAITEGAPLPAATIAKNDAQGVVTFDEIEFTKAGSYTYKVAEVKGSLQHVTYDTNTYEVIVHVTDNLEGRLVAEFAEDFEGIKFVNTYTEPEEPKDEPVEVHPAPPVVSPKTGDVAAIGAMLLLAVVALGDATGVKAYRRKK